MAEYQIFSDGACDIGFEKAEELGIQLIPFYVSIDHENYYKEILEISLDDYFRYMTQEKGYPKTSLPSIQDYIDAFTPALEAGKDILCITMTRSLTASLESAMTAKSMLEEDFPRAKIHVINSWLATGAQSLLLMEMARMQKNGKSLEDVVAYVEKAKADGRIHFMVGDLSYLEIGGRIGKVATVSGGLLKIKPIIILKGGEIGVGGVCRARKKGLSQIVDVTVKHFRETGENPAHYIATPGTNTIWDDMEGFYAKIQEALPGMEFLPPFQIGATISAHTGPGTTGFCFVKKYEHYGF
ncbi:DegV family protein [Anaerotignum sp.]|nr:DegV family protein [Anaerotignum sp.]MBQ7757524.1 DegV family protein [Anaerotignum sp.]